MSVKGWVVGVLINKLCGKCVSCDSDNEEEWLMMGWAVCGVAGQLGLVVKGMAAVMTRNACPCTDSEVSV